MTTKVMFSSCGELTCPGEMMMVKKTYCVLSIFNLHSDHSIEDHLSQVTRSSLDVNVGSLKSVSDKKNMRKKQKNDVKLEKCVSNGFEDRISKWVYSCTEPDLEMGDFVCNKQIRFSSISFFYILHFRQAKTVSPTKKENAMFATCA